MSLQVIWFLLGMVALWGIIYWGYRIEAFENGLTAGGWFAMFAITLTLLGYFGDGYLKANGIDLDKLFPANTVVIETRMEETHDKNQIDRNPTSSERGQIRP